MSKPQRQSGFDATFDRYAFSAIRCRSVWLADAIEMHRDIAALKDLLQMALAATTAAEMQMHLRMAMELLVLHVAISRTILGGDFAAYEPVLIVVEQLEGTDPDDPLYVPRAAAFKSHVEVLVQHEEELIDGLGRANSGEAIDEDVLRRRLEIIGDAASRAHAHGRTRPSVTWLQ